MKGTTIFKTYMGEEIKRSIQPINLNVEDTISIESAPNGKPVLTLYRVETKSIKIDMIGWVHYEYTVNKISEPQEQKFFI